MIKFNKLLFIFFLLVLPSCQTSQKLLNPPERVNVRCKNYSKLVLNSFNHGEFGWTYNDKKCIVGYRKNKNKDLSFYFGVEYYNKLPENLTSEEKDKFSIVKKDISEGKNIIHKQLYYKYLQGVFPNKSKEKNNLSKALSKKYQKALQRSFKKSDNQKPQRLSLKELAKLISEKRIIFLTGAGISLAANIPTMQTLHASLGISEDDSVDGFVKNLLNDPSKIKAKLKEFINSIVLAKPTPAHFALKKIALKKKCQIMTGNFDLLHEKSGIKAYNVEKNNLDKHWNESVVRQIDAIICVGSSYDFMSVLGRYKRLNPVGFIVAINKNQPEYLGNDDFFVEGDIQQTLPKLSNFLKGKVE